MVPGLGAVLAKGSGAPGGPRVAGKIAQREGARPYARSAAMRFSSCLRLG